jgi:hypothetical protein
MDSHVDMGVPSNKINKSYFKGKARASSIQENNDKTDNRDNITPALETYASNSNPMHIDTCIIS